VVRPLLPRERLTFFYVETLADLAKTFDAPRTPEQQVRAIAEKFPEMNGRPCAFHATLALGNLEGYAVPMDYRIPLFGGRTVRVGNHTGVVFEESPEAQAFSRWQIGEFLAIEREIASMWRWSLSTLDLGTMSRSFREIGIGGESSRTLSEAKDVASRVITDPNKAQQLIELALLFLGTPPQQRAIVLSRWRDSGCPPIASYAPYAAYVLTVEVFFQIALAASLISTARPSNRVDIGYLFYLPFAMVFISFDGLHRRCAPLFLRSDQEFVWGADLKKDLVRLNEHFAGFPEGTKEKGIFAFAATPPKDGDFLVARVWDRHLRPWRDRSPEPVQMSPEQEAKLIDQIRQFRKAPELPPDQVDFDPSNPDSLSLERRVRKRKGSWWQLPKGLETNDTW
jgi:hypothetical protein